MASSRRPHPKASKEPPNTAARDAAEGRRFGWQTVVLPIFLGVWLILWSSQTLFDSGPDGRGHPRWQLFWGILFLPDEVLAGWFDGRISLQGIADRLRVVAIVSIVVLPAWLLGRQLLSRGVLRRHASVMELSLLGLAVGMALHATATLLLGLAGIVSHRMTMPLLAVVELAVAVWLGAIPSLKRSASFFATRRKVQAHGLAKLFASIAIVLVGLRCLLPATEFDVLEYHLGAPKQWYQEGRIGFSAENVYANMPMAAEMQTLSAMAWSGSLNIESDWWWGGLAGKATMFVYWGLSIGLTTCLMRRLIGGDLCWWLIAVSTSAVAMAEVTVLGLIEPAVACYLAASMLVLFLLRRRVATHPSACLWLGFLSGSAFACKYPALLFVCVPIGFLVVMRLTKQKVSFLRSLRCLAIFALGILTTAGPWIAKNAVLTGNPVYPLAASIFGARALTTDQVQQWEQAHAVPDRSVAALAEALNRVAFTWRSQDSLLIPLALIGLLSIRRSRVALVAAGLAIYSFAIWWLLTHHLERFLLPVMPIAIVLAGFGLRTVQQQLPRMLTSAMLGTAITANLVILAVSPTMGDPRLFVDTTQIRQEAIEAADSNRIPDHVLWVNQNLQDTGNRLLLVGDAGIFNYEVPIRYSTCFNTSLIATIARLPSEEQSSAFASRGITHVLVHWGEIHRYRSDGNYGFDPTITQSLLQQFVDNSILVPLPTGLDLAHVQVFRVRYDETQAGD
ncbi:MAG: hypothetical protein R3C05_10835 [Pirellulaceae bacterium]